MFVDEVMLARAGSPALGGRLEIAWRLQVEIVELATVAKKYEWTSPSPQYQRTPSPG
jgi:hypothetical protein